MQYFELIAENIKEGRGVKAEQMFIALPKENKKALVKSIATVNWNEPNLKRNIGALITVYCNIPKIISYIII